MVQTQTQVTAFVAGCITIRPCFVDLYTVREVLIDQIYAPVIKHLDQCETIVDVGANIGLASIFLASQFPEARLLAVEPDPETHQALEANLRRLPNPSQIASVAIWSDRSGICRANHSTQQDRISYLEPRSATDADCLRDVLESVTMHDLLSLLEEPRIDLLKIDTEGAEIELFKGAVSWLEMVRCILIEFHGNSRKEADFDRLMVKYGFHIVEDASNIVVARR